MIPRDFLLYVTRVAGNLPGLYYQGGRLAHVWRWFQKPAAVSSVSLSRYLEETEVRGGAEMDTITQAAAHASGRHPELHNRPTGELRSADAQAARFWMEPHGAASAAWLPRSVGSHSGEISKGSFRLLTCEMVLGVAAAFVAVAVFSLSSLECSPTTCLVSSTYISLHYSLNSWVLTGEMSVFFLLCLFRKKVHLVSYFYWRLCCYWWCSDFCSFTSSAVSF